MITDPALFWLVVTAAVVIPLGDLIAGFFFLYLFTRSKSVGEPGTEPTFLTRLLRGRSWLLALLMMKSFVVATVFTYFAILTIRRLMRLANLDWTPITSALALVILGLIPILFMVAFWLTRRRRGNYTLPPFGGQD